MLIRFPYGTDRPRKKLSKTVNRSESGNTYRRHSQCTRLPLSPRGGYISSAQTSSRDRPRAADHAPGGRARGCSIALSLCVCTLYPTISPHARMKVGEVDALGLTVPWTTVPSCLGMSVCSDCASLQNSESTGIVLCLRCRFPEPSSILQRTENLVWLPKAKRQAI